MATNIECTNFNDMMKMIIQTRKHPELIEMVQKYLLQYPDEINKQNNFENTALIVAAMYSNKYSTEETIQMLIDAKADLNFKGLYGYTALMWAAQYSNTTSTERTVQMLINMKANLNLQDNNGYTALIWAALDSNYHSTEKTVQMLIDAKAECKYYNSTHTNKIQLKYNGLFFLDIPPIVQIEYYDISIKSYPYLLKHLYTRNVSNIIRILPFICQFYHYQPNKIVIDAFMAIKN